MPTTDRPPTTSPASGRPPRRLVHAGGVFRERAAAILGAPPSLSDLHAERYPEALVERARLVWQERVRAAFRSVQIASRFLTEVVNAGDPLEVYAGAADLVRHEVRHAALCAALCEALGAEALLPDDLRPGEPESYVAASWPERALASAISTLVIEQTLGAATFEDLRTRCANPAVARVLEATCEDEVGHRHFGLGYVAQSLARFPIGKLEGFREIVGAALGPHRRRVAEVLSALPEGGADPQVLAEPELAELGLFGEVRHAVVIDRCVREELEPKLSRLGLL